MKIFHSNKEIPQFIVMMHEYCTLKTEWLEMKCGKCLYQHSFQDKWIPAKWDMQAKPQLVQHNSLHVAWRYFCQKSSVSPPGSLYLFSTSQFNLLKEWNFEENQRSSVHLIRATNGLQLKCVCPLKVNITYMWYSLTVAVQVSPSVSNFEPYTDWLF
jgi:hypothetical protein